MDHLFFAAVTILPIFLIILLGKLLQKKRIIDDSFVKVSSRIVFTVALPSLIFSQIAVTDFFTLFEWREVAAAATVTLLLFVIALVSARIWIPTGSERGSFVACSIHGNVAILGLAVIGSVYGDNGLARGAIILSFMMPLYNILTVTGLYLQVHDRTRPLNLPHLFIRVFTNPLILAAVFALPFSLTPMVLPPLLLRTFSMLGQMALPVALIGIGASLRFDTLKASWKKAAAAGLLKIILAPILAGVTAYAMGLQGSSIGLLILFTGAPTAVVTFILSHSMGADGPLAASIITIDTLGAILTMGGSIYLIRLLGWV
jgi:predicted permease